MVQHIALDMEYFVEYRHLSEVAVVVEQFQTQLQIPTEHPVHENPMQKMMCL
jgi:hypothetical protein